MRDHVLRPLIAILGIFAIGWAASVIRIYFAEASLADTAKAIISGDKFNQSQLGTIKRRIDAAPADLTQASASSGATVIRVFLLEEALRSGIREVSVSDYDRLQLSVNNALGQSPSDSFMWLTAFWLKRLRAEAPENGLNLLRMSYRSGPNEAWIAIRRSSFALGLLGSLPPDLADQALSDFVGLIRSGFYQEAADVLKGPGWAARNQLLSKLLAVDLSDRRAFARTLTAKNIDGVSVPGVQDEPSHRF